jgi:hypothetical protein
MTKFFIGMATSLLSLELPSNSYGYRPHGTLFTIGFPNTPTQRAFASRMLGEDLRLCK